jgi:hypothetical protein
MAAHRQSKATAVGRAVNRMTLPEQANCTRLEESTRDELISTAGGGKPGARPVCQNRPQLVEKAKQWLSAPRSAEPAAYELLATTP